jgi:hypothetical protein
VLGGVQGLLAPHVLRGQLGDHPGAVRVDEHALDLAQRLVAAGPVDRPGRRQLLADAEDLLDHQPAVRPDRRAQHAHVPAGVGQAVRVVDADRVHVAVGHPAQDLPVRLLEDRRVLHAHRGERGHVEEPPVGQLAGAAPPGRQPVVLARVHLQGGALVRGALGDRVGVLVVAQLGAVVGELEPLGELLLLVGRVGLGVDHRQQDRPGVPSRCRTSWRARTRDPSPARPTTTGWPWRPRRRRGWARCRARTACRARAPRRPAPAGPARRRARPTPGSGRPRRSRGSTRRRTPAAARRRTPRRPGRRGSRPAPGRRRRSAARRAGSGRWRRGRSQRCSRGLQPLQHQHGPGRHGGAWRPRRPSAGRPPPRRARWTA